jgi:vacuolar-type H+-ATPase subunit H
MKRDRRPPSDADVDAAISRVLAAEQAAREAIAATERESDALIDAARADARAIGERTERRIRVARERFEAKVEQEVDAIRREAAALETRHVPTADEVARVERAVRTLAAELTGGAP